MAEASPAAGPLGGVGIDSVHAAAYTVPTDAPEADGTLAWDSTTVVVVHVAAGGEVGTGWTYGPPACAAVVRDVLADVVTGRPAASVPATWEAMVRTVRNATRAGVADYAVSAVDVACWDLKARLLDTPLADLLGRAHDAVPVYGSGGFTSYDDGEMVEQLTRWSRDERIPRVKIKIGESWGTRPERDLARVRRAREAVGDEVAVYVDANGGYTRKQAVRLARPLAELGVSWFEEPVSSDDLDGLRVVRDAVDLDVAAGEYGTGVTYFTRMCAAGAVDCLQADATRCGGYTEFLRAAAVAAGQQLEVSGHCAPNLHAPVAAAVPNLRHLEWFHDHVRIERMLFDGSLDPSGGVVTPDPSARGHGMTLRPAVAERFRVDRD